MGQALWVWVTLLPVLILNGSRADNNFQWSDVVGAVLWVVGFACEATADLQKSAFKSKPENKGKFINTGAHAQDNPHIGRATLSSVADHTTYDAISIHTARRPFRSTLACWTAGLWAYARYPNCESSHPLY